MKKITNMSNRGRSLFILFKRDDDLIVMQTLYSRLSLNGHLYKTDTSVKQTPIVGPCLSLLPLFDSL